MPDVLYCPLFTHAPMPSLVLHQLSPIFPKLLGPLAVLMAICSATIHPTQAQQPIRPVPRHGLCPTGYAASASGSYCLPTKDGRTRGAIVKVGHSCPQGFTAWGNYCLSASSNRREAVQKIGDSCPQGWYASQDYCMVATGNKRREAIVRVGRDCPQGFAPSGDYCLGYSNQEREVVLRTGHLCPSGWSKFGAYCLQAAK